MTDPYDLLVIGGGINGASIARAAAQAGQRVLLVEQGDLAQATSSASTKLMHGGLRYLEYFQIKLVREALQERALMLRVAPHLVRPLEFRLPHDPSIRPWWMVRAGLWMYDLFAWRGGFPRSRSLKFRDADLQQRYASGFSYWDGWVDDSRLVVLNALDTAEAGGEIRTRTRFITAQRGDSEWTATLESAAGQSQVRARTIVNAVGPWVDQVLRHGLGVPGRVRARLVRGSHVIFRLRLSGQHAWLLQQPDGRIIFAIPYLGDCTLVGTTEIPVERAEDDNISAAEVEYLLTAVNRYLRRPLTHAEIVGHFSGVRPLFDDGADAASAVSRDYRLELDCDGAPLLSVFGGKITTARKLAQQALERLGIEGGDTSQRPLPGGDIANLADFLATASRRWPFIDADTIERMVHAYGTRISDVLGDATKATDLGIDFGGGLTAREVDYLVTREWAVTTDDILWRRSKLGMRLFDAQVRALQAYLQRPVARRTLAATIPALLEIR